MVQDPDVGGGHQFGESYITGLDPHIAASRQAQALP